MHLDSTTSSLERIRENMRRIRATPQSDHVGVLEEEKCIGPLTCANLGDAP
jgi:hypothetical protein